MVMYGRARDSGWLPRVARGYCAAGGTSRLGQGKHIHSLGRMVNEFVNFIFSFK